MSSFRVRTDDEIYNMMMFWISRQNFSQNSRRFLVNTDLYSRSSYIWGGSEHDDDDEDESGEEESSVDFIGQKQTLHYTPSFGSHLFWYKGRPLMFERHQNQQQVNFQSASEREELSISCFGRNPQILKELLQEARLMYLKKDERKTLIYRGTSGSGMYGEPYWQRSMSRLNRPFSTVILSERLKQNLIDDAADYLNPATRRWYANRGIPYRRGYLLHGPPGTGKSSLSLALAGYFRMKIYIVSLSSLSATEENLTSLFGNLPTRCLVLLEDIDSAGLTHTRDESSTSEMPRETIQAVPSPESPSTPTPSNRLSLSGLLNILDGVASQEGRILIMTTNHVEKLDKALIRPGRVDMVIPFGLADADMIASIFCAIYAPFEDENLPAQKPNTGKGSSPADSKGSDKLVNKEMTKLHAEIIDRISELAKVFTAKIPEHEFSPAEIQGLLLRYKRDPEAAIESAWEWVVQTRKDKEDRKLKEEERLRKVQEDAEKKKREEAEKAEKTKAEEAEKTKKEQQDTDKEKEKNKEEVVQMNGTKKDEKLELLNGTKEAEKVNGSSTGGTETP